MDEEVKAPKKRLKKVDPVVEPVETVDPEREKWNRELAKEAKRNYEMEHAFEQMAIYVHNNENDPALDVEFYVDEKARVIVARVEYLIDDDATPGEALAHLCRDTIKYGLARCMEGDRWNPLLGRYLALKRAKGTAIPARILAAIGHVMY